ncbi:MAG TPA: CPBP family intramembrane glutamic endopeptidase [Propionibacteriaceae bacterium]|nr:CPBP family intramembrane glutamic endopeptidase [Propionibacteriaceae bacterium]
MQTSTSRTATAAVAAASPSQTSVPHRPSQYTRTQILGVWAAAAVPMAALAWVMAPWLAGQLNGPTAAPRALMVALTAGLVWQFALVLMLVHREQSAVRWAVLKDALWLQAPRSPRTGRTGGLIWLAVVPAVLVFGARELLPSIAAATGRDLPSFLGSTAGADLLAGSWGWLTLIVVMAVFNTVLGEELLFRGLLLPRMQSACGRADWIVNGVLFATYHLHMPWVIPTTLIDTLALSYPARRYRSALIAIAVHSTQSVVIITLTLLLVLR